MKAKSGTAVNTVAPTAPEEVFAADQAKPGEVAKAKAKQTKNQKGKYGSTKAKAYKPVKQQNQSQSSSTQSNAQSLNQSGANSSSSTSATTTSPSANMASGAGSGEAAQEEVTKTDWIEIEFVGEDGKPIPGEKYEITLPDGSIASGTLDSNGFARVDGFEPGKCKISFPNLDTEAWEPSK